MERVKKKKFMSPKSYGCRICGDAANDHLNFGAAFCCMSCKAFFRRTVRGNVQYPPCIYGGTCIIDVQNRTLCCICRFQKCLKIGMDPKWVMKNSDIEEKNQMKRMKELLKDQRLNNTNTLQTEYEIKTKLERTRQPKRKTSAGEPIQSLVLNQEGQSTSQTSTNSIEVVSGSRDSREFNGVLPKINSYVAMNKDIGNCYLTIEEDNWISHLSSTYHQICGRITHDEKELDLLIFFRKGNLKQKMKVRSLGIPLLFARYNSLLERILGNHLTQFEASDIAKKNYPIVGSMFCIKLDFLASTTFLHQLEFICNKKLPNHIDLLSCPPMSMPECYPFGNKDDDHFEEKYLEKGRQIATFLRRKDLNCLLILFTLLQSSTNFEAQKLFSCVHRLILKKMRLCREFDCWPNPDAAIDFFYHSLYEFSIMVNQVITSLDQL